jgi:RHS repeat-associated protein
LKEQSYASSDDTFGNVTSRNYNGTTATLSSDGLDQLVTWNAGSSSQEQYVYDAYGGRVLRRSTMAGITTMTVYAFGLEEHLYSGTGVNQGNTYYYSLAGHLIGELTNAGTNMVLTDALGSVITTISATAGSASVQGNQAYGPYGNSRYQAGTMGTAKGFTGQYQDATGLDYYGARYYDPVVGRFLSADTVQGNEAGMDPYAYVGGNPETKNDPTGQAYCFAGGCNSEVVDEPICLFDPEC